MIVPCNPAQPHSTCPPTRLHPSIIIPCPMALLISAALQQQHSIGHRQPNHKASVDIYILAAILAAIADGPNRPSPMLPAMMGYSPISINHCPFAYRYIHAAGCGQPDDAREYAWRLPWVPLLASSRAYRCMYAVSACLDIYTHVWGASSRPDGYSSQPAPACARPAAGG